MGFISPSAVVPSKNTSLHIFCRTPWEVSQKVSEFFDSQKLLFRTVDHQILWWEIPRNSSNGSKTSLKISVASFILIMCPKKFQNILIVKSTWTNKISQQLTNLKTITNFDKHIRSVQHWNVARDRSFLTASHLRGSLV